MSKRAALCLCWLTVATSGTSVPAAQRSLDSEVRRQRGPVATIETFTLDLDPAVAAEIIEARAGRTARPPVFVVAVRNRGIRALASCTITAALVTGAGAIKILRPIDPFEDLAPARQRRRDVRLGAAPAPADRIAFVVTGVEFVDGERWAASPEVLR